LRAPPAGQSYHQDKEVAGTRILVVEDAAKLLAVLCRRLRGAGYAVDGAATGAHALRLTEQAGYDTIVLDLRLPDMDGLEVCRRVRAAGSAAPILILTARDAVPDRVDGLDAGADDYLAKPFSFEELFARVRALTRRPHGPRPATLVHGPFVLDPAARVVRHRATPVDLTPKEFALLEYLMRHQGVAMGRARLLAHVWDGAHQSDSNVVDVYVRRLRSKLAGAGGGLRLETVRGIGYRLGEPGTATPVA
jgi:two-component system, OmpR family, response regulator